MREGGNEEGLKASSSPFKGEARREMGAPVVKHRHPIPTLTLPLKGREAFLLLAPLVVPPVVRHSSPVTRYSSLVTRYSSPVTRRFFTHP